MSGHLDTEQARDLAAKRKHPGRKRRAEEEEIKKALRKALPEEDAVKRLAELCRGRNALPALTLYFAYLWGKPKETKEISGLDGGEIGFTVRYVNNWRADTAHSAPGAEDGIALAGALQVADGGQAVAQDNPGDGNGD